VSVGGNRVVIYKIRGDSTVAFFATTAGGRKTFKSGRFNPSATFSASKRELINEK
jgi:hypothetical protein